MFSSQQSEKALVSGILLLPELEKNLSQIEHMGSGAFAELSLEARTFVFL